MQSAGKSLALASHQLRTAMQASPTLHATLLRFVHAVLAQASQTVTHEFLSLLLGVRRQGVTETLHKLEAAGLIKTGRNLLTVLDGLRRLAGGFYGAPEAEYERLLSGDAAPRRPPPE